MTQNSNKGPMNWLLNKAESFIKNHFTSVYNNRMDKLTNEEGFREISDKKFAGKDATKEQKDATHKRLADLAKNNPNKFNELMKYDVRDSSFGKYFK